MIRLTATERRRLLAKLRKTHDARVYRRTLAVLQAAQGCRVREIAAFLHVSPRSVFRWLGFYAQEHDPEALTDCPGRGRDGLWDSEHWSFLDELIEDSPQDWGYAATQWTVPLLQGHLEGCGLPPCSQATLRRRLRDRDWVWKRPRYVLDPDPQAEKKTRHSEAAHGPAGPQRRTGRGRDAPGTYGRPAM